MPHRVGWASAPGHGRPHAACPQLNKVRKLAQRLWRERTMRKHRRVKGAAVHQSLRRESHRGGELGGARAGDRPVWDGVGL